MDKQAENFIKLVSSYINNKTVNISDVDWTTVVEYAKIHSLGGIIYSSIEKNKLDIDKEILNPLREMFFVGIKHSALQEVVTNKVIALLNENNIPHILFKGYILKNYYPDKELRTMGDIDIVVEKCRQIDVHNILINNGFIFDEFESKQSVRNYSFKGILFEVHTEIISDNFIPDVDMVGYFKNNFEYAICVNECTYEFKSEHHFIYLILHLAKHFNYSGCGVRMLLDLALFVNHFEVLDWNYIEVQLKKLKLFDFASKICALCGIWFDVKFPIENREISEKMLDSIAIYIIQGGVFGYENKNMDAIIFAKDSNSVGARIITILNFIFPSYDTLSTRYVWCEKIPKFLLPCAWVKFWHFRIAQSNKNDFKRLIQSFKNNDDIRNHAELLKAVGLKVEKMK